MRRTLTSVRFAVIQIIALAVSGLFGTILPQLPAFALHDPNAYASEMAAIHERWDPVWSAGVVDVFERLGLLRVFSAPWFVGLMVVLTVSIVICTLDRTPKLWRGVRRVTVEQPEPFFDLRSPGRARFEAEAVSADDLTRTLRGRHFRVRRAMGDASEVTWLYGDRNQYMKMATLLTHLGLVLFLAGGAVTAAMGFETVVFLGEGQTAPVQPVGTPHNLLVKNIHFEAPQRPDGGFIDFRTDLAVYRDGEQVARKTIRVNDPLTVDGFVFHQNTFGPAADIEVRDQEGLILWTGPVLLADEFLGLPEGFLTVPGSGVGLLMYLQRDAAGTPILAMLGVGPPEASGASRFIFQTILGIGATTDPVDTAGYAITWVRPGAWTGMVIKNDPGAPIIWIAFLSLITGLLLSFYFPRRRVWARITRDGTRLAFIGDRYVDEDREFGALLDELAARSGSRPERAPVA